MAKEVESKKRRIKKVGNEDRRISWCIGKNECHFFKMCKWNEKCYKNGIDENLPKKKPKKKNDYTRKAKKVEKWRKKGKTISKEILRKIRK